jgi:hypothetical protein
VPSQSFFLELAEPLRADEALAFSVLAFSVLALPAPALAELDLAVLALLAPALVLDLPEAMLVIFTWVYFWR